MSRCIHEGCKKRSSFNNEGEIRGLYCAEHKLEGMVNVKNPKCIQEGCKKTPAFNIEGETKRLYCGEHKLYGMINVVSSTCIHPYCKTQPIFNIEGETKGLYCSKHKKEEMVNVKSPSCIHPGCKKLPTFNNEGKTKRLYCKEHKQKGMVDVTHPTCIHLGCKTRPTFNNEGETKRLYCAEHKQEGMIDVTHPTCKTHLCLTRVTEKYDGYCLFCYMNMFPDKPVSRNYKTKEYAVVEFVKTSFPDLTWVADKRVQDGCSKRRPDLILDLGYQILIIEVDEDQHRIYYCSCENKRIMELSQDLDHRPVVFIRFNPDEYINNNTNIKSCWGINKKGICVVKKQKQNEWVERLNTLKNQIEYWMNPNNKTNKTVEIVQLFYDTEQPNNISS